MIFICDVTFNHLYEDEQVRFSELSSEYDMKSHPKKSPLLSELYKAIQNRPGICLKAEVSKMKLYNEMTVEAKKKIRQFMILGDINNATPKILEVGRVIIPAYHELSGCTEQLYLQDLQKSVEI